MCSPSRLSKKKSFRRSTPPAAAGTGAMKRLGIRVTPLEDKDPNPRFISSSFKLTLVGDEGGVQDLLQGKEAGFGEAALGNPGLLGRPPSRAEIDLPSVYLLRDPSRNFCQIAPSTIPTTP